MNELQMNFEIHHLDKVRNEHPELDEITLKFFLLFWPIFLRFLWERIKTNIQIALLYIIPCELRCL